MFMGSAVPCLSIEFQYIYLFYPGGFLHRSNSFHDFEGAEEGWFLRKLASQEHDDHTHETARRFGDEAQAAGRLP
jgi:hypothetical protein